MNQIRMKTKGAAIALTLIIAFFAAGSIIMKTEAAQKAQTICPVLGNAIDKEIYTDYKGYRIYFCCNGCPNDFIKNPAKYMKILKDSGVALEKSAK
jgi:YHS domain-containing protein